MSTEAPESAREQRPWFRFLFVKPILAALLCALLMLTGGLGYRSMPKETYPDLEIAQALVFTAWPGASPEMVEKQITIRLERRLRALAGVKEVRSGSRESFSVVSVAFRAEAAMAEAMQRLRAAVAEVSGELPKKAEKPRIEQLSVGDSPVLTAVVHGPVGEPALARLGEHLRRELRRLPGVRKVTLAGARERVVRIDLSLERLAAVGLSPAAVRQAIEEANLDVPCGELRAVDAAERQPSRRLTYAGRFDDLGALRRLPLLRSAARGATLTLGDVAEIEQGLAPARTHMAFSKGGSPLARGLYVSVLRLPGQDTLALIERVKAELKRLAAAPSWPKAVKTTVVADESEFIESNLSMVFGSGWQAMLAVFGILFLLLGWREALVAGLAIPLTFLGALGLLDAFGHTLNELVLIGMVLALGLLVDVFILVMEGMHEGLYQRRLSFAAAARETVKAYALPASAGQLTTVMALLPLFLIGGQDGRFIRLIPVTMVVCLLLALIIAFLVCIPLSRLVLPKRASGEPSRIDRLAHAVGEGLSGWLRRKVLVSRRRAGLWVAATVGLLLFCLGAAATLPSQLYPKADGRNLGITVQLSSQASLAQARGVARRLGALLAEKPYLASVATVAGSKSPFALESLGAWLEVIEAPRLVGISCVFTPRDERDRLAFTYLEELRRELRDALRDEPGALLLLHPNLGGADNSAPLALSVVGDDLATLRRLVRQLEDVVSRDPGVTDLRDDLGAPGQKLLLRPRRDALAFHRIPEAQVAASLRIAMVDDKVGRYRQPGTQADLPLRLAMRWPGAQRRSPEGQSRATSIHPTRYSQLALLEVLAPRSGRPIPLARLVRRERRQGASGAILHLHGQRTATLYGRTAKGHTAQQIIDRLRPRLAKLQKTWPKGYTLKIGGEVANSAETFGSSSKALALAIFGVFAVLALLFGSFRQPLIVLGSIPLALIGVAGGFVLAWMPLSFPAMVGVISLVGVVVNDAIVIVERINTHRRTGADNAQAASLGAADRLRPVLSTTLTTTVGLIPLAFSNPMWLPLCSAIIFGLLAATVITLVIIPALYVLSERSRAMTNQAES